MSSLPSTAFRYVDTEIPAGMTIREWRRAAAQRHPRPRRRHLLGRHRHRSHAA